LAMPPEPNPLNISNLKRFLETFLKKREVESSEASPYLRISANPRTAK